MASLKNSPSLHQTLFLNNISQPQKHDTHSCSKRCISLVRADLTTPPSPNSHAGGQSKRRPLMLGVGALTASLVPTSTVFAEEIPKSYRAFVDASDGYSYYYPSDWREFDFLGHDSAFKDRYLQLQNVRVRFIPTDKKDVHDLGPMEEVLPNLVKHVYSAPNQFPNILDMQEQTTDGKTYYTVEFQLISQNFASASFATIAIANGRYYTQIVGANDRRWRRFRNQLKVIADSFKVLDI
uniref:PsbP-like protein 2 n=1 Tax=Melianthus villosus TaxID=377280 RepID=A0A0F7GYQ2_9ROSI